MHRFCQRVWAQISAYCIDAVRESGSRLLRRSCQRVRGQIVWWKMSESQAAITAYYVDAVRESGSRSLLRSCQRLREQIDA